MSESAALFDTLMRVVYANLPAALALAYLGWLIVAAAGLLLARRAPVSTMAWLLAFTFLPVAGAVLYVLIGPHRLKRRRLRRDLGRRLADALAPASPLLSAEAQIEHADALQLARVGLRRAERAPRRAARLTILCDGDDTYAVLEAAMAAAQHHIHLEYYIWEPDAVGTRWRDLLIERARKGVEIRLLIDAVGSKRCGDAFWAPLRAAGGAVAVFNPLHLRRFRPSLMNFRTHRKIVVIDGCRGYTGGINVCVEHARASSGGSAWRDTHLALEGAPVSDLQRIFLEDWQYATDGSLRHAAAQWFPAHPVCNGPWVQIIDSGPDELVPDIQRFYFTAITQARQRVWLATPYFVPDEPVQTALLCAAARGVDVRLMIPEQGDSRLVAAAALSFAEEAAAAGVRVLRYEPRMIHAKTLITDHGLAVIGTANLDNRSFRLNFELIAAIYDGTANTELALQFERDSLSATPLPGAPRRRPLAQRLLIGLARLFSPLL